MRLLIHFTAVALSVTVCGCMGGTWSVNPLTAPEQARLDDRFLGVWQTDGLPSGDDVDQFVHVSSAGEHFPKGMMRLLVVYSASRHQEFLGFVSTIDDQQYFNLLLPHQFDLSHPDPAKLEKWDPKCDAAFALFEVQHSDTSIRLRMMGKDLERHVKAGDVSGNITTKNGRTTSVELTAPTKDLAQFVSKYQKSLFDRTETGARFVRLKKIE